MIGESLGHYRLLEKIAAGGMLTGSSQPGEAILANRPRSEV